MKYPLLKGQSIEYNVLHAIEAGMRDVWQIRKHLLLQGAAHVFTAGQIHGALNRLRRAGLVSSRDGVQVREEEAHA